MKIQTQSVHFDADASLLEFIQKKVEKLNVFYDRIINADVFLRFGKKMGKFKTRLLRLG